MSNPPRRPLVLVTGASSGIGLELARLFADAGNDLLITAEDNTVHVAAEDLRRRGVEVDVVQADLRTTDEVEKLVTAVTATGRPLAAAALNAGVGRGGAFLDVPLADDFSIIELNVMSTVHLAKRLLPDMVRRGRGKMLVTSSIASTMPGAFQATYNASKSFLQSFTEALQNELKGTGVTLTALMPGPTETNFFHRAGMENTRVGRSDKDDPAAVARQGYEALMAGKDRVVASSITTKTFEAVNKVLPDKVKAAAHRVMAKPD